jgi:hypothetical protein
MRILCQFIGHSPSVPGAIKAGGSRSVCKRCDAPMIRLQRGRWEVAANPNPPIPTAKIFAFPGNDPATRRH